MGRSLTEVVQQQTSSGGGTRSDPWQQPCFTVYSMEHSDGGGGFFSYDHNLNMLSNVRGNGGNHYGSYRTYSSQASEFMQNHASNSAFETTGSASSNSHRPSLTSFVGYLGHIQFTPPQPNGFGGWIRNGNPAQDRAGHAFRDVNAIVGETRQDYAWFTQHSGGNHLVRFSQRSANTYYSDYESGYGGYIQVGCAWSQSMYGGSCYNARTKKVCFMETNTSHQFRPVVYSNAPDIRAISTNYNPYYNVTQRNDGYSEHTTGELYDYFNNSANRVQYSTSTGKPTNNDSEDNYRCITCLCDNDKVVMFQMIPHYGSWCHRWDTSGNAEGSILNMSHTTSYGYPNGSRFGVRWQVSSDGEYLFAYCSGYYYGCGIMGVIIRVTDGKIIYTQHNDGSYGHQICPVGKSDFLMAMQVNSDGGPGMYYRMIRTEREMHRLNDRSHASMHSSMRTYMIDTPYYSTAYPGLIPAFYDTHLFTTQIPDAETVMDT